MFVTSPRGQVIAIDARSGSDVCGDTVATSPQGTLVPHDTNRGVALFGDKVFYAAGEAALVALDAKTGKEVWATKVADNRADNNAVYYITLAPLVADGKILVGTSGADFGIRGFVAAYRPGYRQGNCGAPTRSRRPVNPAATRGRTATTGRKGAPRFG